MKAKLHHLTAAACLAVALTVGIVLAACTDDARTPGADPTTQPLILNATVAAPTASPATRANTAASQWTDGDEVAVEVDGIAKRYIVKATAGATATLSPADAANTHFWPGLNQPVIVRAWRYGDGYRGSMLTGWSVFATQSATDNGESYYQQSDFLYAPAKSVSYDAASGAGLTFYHQTARMEVRIRKAGAVNNGNINSIRVYFGYGDPDDTMLLDGTFDASQIDPDAGQYSGLTADETTVKGDITPNPIPTASTPTGYARCYEALVIPQDMRGKKLICINIGSKNYYYTPAPDDDHANLRGGYTYTYDITVSEHGTLQVTVGTPITPWSQEVGGSGTAYEIIDLDNPQTISDNGVYLLTGSAVRETINITGGSPTLIVKDLYLMGSIHITGGTPGIRVEGTNNEITGMMNLPPIWLDGDNANVRITGDGITESKLELSMMTADAAPAAIGTHGPDGASAACGNIEISNLTLRTETGSTGRGVGAAIGTGGDKGNRKCGNITITDAHIIAVPGFDAVAIGFGSIKSNAINTDMTGTTYEMGDITLTNSTIESAIFRTSNIYPAHIGGGVVAAETYKVGAIRINTDKSAREFFAKFSKRNGIGNKDDEVIVGFPAGAEPKDGTRFDIYWNGKPVGTPITWGMVPTLP